MKKCRYAHTLYHYGKTLLEGGLDPDQHSMATLDPGSVLRFWWIQIGIQNYDFRTKLEP